MNFEIQNQALLLKQLHKFYCQADTPWVKLVWSLYSPDVPPHAQTRRGSAFNIVTSLLAGILQIAIVTTTRLWLGSWRSFLLGWGK